MSIHVKIYDTDTADEIAKKIYIYFEVMASCSIYGFVTKGESLIPKGQCVLDSLRKLDEMENIKKDAIGRLIRKFKYRKDSIGGPIAHKIFTWEIRIIDSEPRYTIWRYQ